MHTMSKFFVQFDKSERPNIWIVLDNTDRIKKIIRLGAT